MLLSNVLPTFFFFQLRLKPYVFQFFFFFGIKLFIFYLFTDSPFSEDRPTPAPQIEADPPP